MHVGTPSLAKFAARSEKGLELMTLTVVGVPRVIHCKLWMVRV